MARLFGFRNRVDHVAGRVRRFRQHSREFGCQRGDGEHPDLEGGIGRHDHIVVDREGQRLAGFDVGEKVGWKDRLGHGER